MRSVNRDLWSAHVAPLNGGLPVESADVNY
jgi:hypothetical protein